VQKETLIIPSGIAALARAASCLARQDYKVLLTP
jgi:hypothetical protein